MTRQKASSKKRSKKYQKFLNDFVKLKAENLKERPTPDNFALFMLSSIMAASRNDEEGIDSIHRMRQ